MLLEEAPARQNLSFEACFAHRLMEYAEAGWQIPESLLDEATDQQVSGGNTDLVLAALGWMCENDAPVIDVTSKSLTMSYLTVPQFDAAYWSIIVCGVIPVVFLLIGTVIWFKRRKQ